MDNSQGEVSDKIHGQKHASSTYNTRFAFIAGEAGLLSG